MNAELKDLIITAKCIDDDLCDLIVDEAEEWDWVKHSWYNYNQSGQIDHYSNDNKELDVLYYKQIPTTYTKKLYDAIKQSWIMYMMTLPTILGNDTPCNMIQSWSNIRLNRYNAGTMMRPHYDHIDSLFDGEKRGIPIISVVGALNNSSEYEGGTLKFWGDYEVKLNKGDIVLFPSCFMYPHEVDEITKGTRYTFVSWGY